jgi:hypothetical protein
LAVDEVRPLLVKTGIDATRCSLDPLHPTKTPEDDIEDFRTTTTGQYWRHWGPVVKRNGKPCGARLRSYPPWPARSGR